MRRGAEQGARGGMPKILLGARKRNAQVTQGKINIREEKSVEKAQHTFTQFYQGMKQESQLGLDLPGTSVPAGKMIFSLEAFNFFFAENGEKWLENCYQEMEVLNSVLIVSEF
jgi:hypothetical protein